MPKKAIRRNEWPSPRRTNGHWCYWFFESVYRENVHLIWPVTEEQRRAYIRHNFKAENFSTSDANDYQGRTSEVFYEMSDGSKRSAQVISLAEWSDAPCDYAILAHEALHAVGNILSLRGALYDNSHDATNEPFAYLLEFITLRCCEALRMAR